ncbi:hypothetical protein FOVG_13939 [Fusarium oxysporum f. sp. pisi HDV247]|uniref:Uncharacterized protein n=1 Tax=Fusarium oxysporum f. sp. pisi HDV247 TaxID=1080344 RepID=W9NQW6_FUSOX|nr:hypothetical protein FOVG_13939 [Fusarium oxysporum f. sp. pisi HDV247]
MNTNLSEDTLGVCFALWDAVCSINDRGLGMIVIYTVYNLEVTIQWSEVKQQRGREA